MNKNYEVHEHFCGDVKYPYALVEESNLIHISSITNDNKKLYSFVCPYCHEELKPRLGIKNRHCFYHENGSRCSIDKYIHETGKRLIKKRFEEGDSFKVTLKTKEICKNHDDCYFYNSDENSNCSHEILKTVDLKKYYNICLEETKIGNFVPDLTLKNSDSEREPVFIEIWYKHKSEKEKIESQNRIIEIRVKTVDDLKDLYDKPLIESDDIHFYNFKPSILNPIDVGDISLTKFVLYKSHKFYVNHKPGISCANYIGHNNNSRSPGHFG